MRNWLVVLFLLTATGFGVAQARLAHSDEPQVVIPANLSSEAALEVAPPEEILALNPSGSTGETLPETGGGAEPEGGDSALVDRVTWVGSITGTFQELCLPCHPWATSYVEVAQRVQNGQMQVYLDIDHFISGGDKQEVLTWIEGGHPEQ